MTAELQGFSKVENKGIVVNVGQTLDIDIDAEGRERGRDGHRHRRDAAHRDRPRRRSAASSTSRRIESLPLNGRQFANLAATIPGVGLGFHSDPTKSTQYSPQINGGNGRNVNYQIDGGDNNDDTVGGLLQLFPLEAIQEFNFVTQRYKAEYGRSNGGVMNIVTKSGTNDCQRQLLRALPRQVDERADRDREDRGNVDKQDYRRNQFGGSFGGPIVQGQGALLRRGRADAAGHDAGGQHAGAVPDAGRRLRRRRTARTCSPAR